MGLLPSPGGVLADAPLFLGASATFPALRESRRGFLGGGGGGARSALKSRGRGKASGPGFLFGGRGRRPPAPNAAAPGAAAAFSIPGDTLPPREDEPPPLDLFPILGREGG